MTQKRKKIFIKKSGNEPKLMKIEFYENHFLVILIGFLSILFGLKY